MERDLKLMNRSRGLYFLGILLFYFVRLFASRQAVLGGQDPQESSSSASGSEQQKAVEAPSDVSATTEIQACQSCHGDITASFERTPHWKTMNDTRGGHAKQGCEACHGPGGDHADDPSKPVFDFKKATSEDTTDRCLTCHASGSEHLSASNSFHRQNNVSCTSCHSMHHATTREHMLIKREPGLCYSCHLQQKAQFNMPFRHRVNEGLITCTDCHNQHGTSGALEGDHLVRQVRASSSGDVVCFKCHTDKQGPFVFEHEAVRFEGCTSCHTPHGNSNPRLLKRSQVNLLCMECHAFSADAGAPATPTFHNQAQKYQACTM